MSVLYFGSINELPANDRKAIEDLVSKCIYAIVSTCSRNAVPRISALNVITKESIDKISFATDINSGKVKNMKENPAIECMFTDGEGQAVLMGNVEVKADMKTKKSIWADWMIDYFPKGIEDETLCVVSFTTTGIRAMI